MRLWKLVLAGALLSAVVFMPTAPSIRQATMPEVVPIAMAELKLEAPVQENLTLPSRSPVSSYAPAQRPLEGIRIVVDPGHGGQARWEKLYYCGGTIGVATGQTESDVNLRVSLCLRQYLEAAGAEVIMTRISDDRCTNGGDKSDELDYRSNLANAKNADLFISVHHNEGTNRSTNYTAVFFPSGMTSSITLADNIASAVSRYMGVESIGARPGSYRVLKGVKMPSVIVEASFMSNHAEDQRLSQLSYNKTEAKAIATGIMNYIRMSKGRQVDFNTIFAPIDDQAGSAQAIADATLVRKQIIEKRGLFGVRYAEVTYDALGNVTNWREIGGSPVKNVASKAATKITNSTKKVASVAKKTVSSASSRSKSSSKSSSKSTVSSKSSSKSKTSGSTKVTVSSSKKKAVVSDSKSSSSKKSGSSSKSSSSSKKTNSSKKG